MCWIGDWSKEQLKDLEGKLTEGLEKAYINMLELKKQKNTPVVMSKDGEVVEVDPNTIISPKK